MSKIIYIKTDQAPALTTLGFLPIINAFALAAGIVIKTTDIAIAQEAV